MSEKLKLRTQDADDLTVVSACLQDSIIPINDMGYLPDQQRFVFVANRFRWETAPDVPPSALAVHAGTAAEGDTPFLNPDEECLDCPYERTNCAVCFENVTAVKYRGINLRARNQMLSLLAVTWTGDAVVLSFAGGGAIRLETAAPCCVVEDVGEPWPTRLRPRHPLDEDAA